MVRHLRLYRRLAALTGLLLVCAAGAATLIMVRNYRAMHSLLEAEPASTLLAAPGHTGIDGIEAVSFRSSKLELTAWYVPARNGAAIILAHGTNADRSSMLTELRLLSQAGFGVLAFDWPGLGNSEGQVRWDGQARRALSAAIDWLAARPDVDASRIGALGFSIGGFVLARVAAEDTRLRAVVLEAPPSSFEDYVQEHCRHWGFVSEWAGRFALRDSGLFDPESEPVRVVGSIAPRPVLLIAGANDIEVPSRFVEKIFESARTPREMWIVPGAGHGNYAAVAPDAYPTMLKKFFAVNLRPR
jgi:dipeptidyl aminopeptidase/acylaminoacyl peptidase